VFPTQKIYLCHPQKIRLQLPKQIRLAQILPQGQLFPPGAPRRRAWPSAIGAERQRLSEMHPGVTTRPGKYRTIA
jgi:hypothetical protein